MKILVIVSLLFTYNLSFAQLNMVLKAQVQYNEDLSDIWGYSDSLGNEYALVCLKAGIAIENITDASNPERIAIIPSPRSIWRDAKTYGEFAYFTNESSGGLQVVNLKNLPNAPDSTDSYFWEPVLPGMGKLTNCHNLYIDTNTGYCYLSGCNINNGGVLIVDVFSDPGNPIFVAAAAPVYAHDVYAREDFIYTSDVYAGLFSIQNISDKDNIFTVASQSTPFNFTHNTWLSDDGKTIFTTDETGNSPVAAYDISDLTDIKLLDEFRPLASINERLIPHNVHIKNDFLITSYYTEGIIIIDAHRPQNLIEVGNYDTFDGPNGSFNGVWGAFPFFESGTVIGSDISSGLFVLSPTYVRACYLEGTVVDSTNGELLSQVSVEILSNDLNNSLTNISGDYKTGQATSGVFMVEYSKSGYTSKVETITLENGVVTLLDIQLVKSDDILLPPVSIVKSIDTGCSPLELNLSPSRVEEGVVYEWAIEGPLQFNLTGDTLDLVLEQAGSYSIILKLVQPNGNREVIDESNITVLGSPKVSFEISTEGNTINTTNTTENGNNYIWEFGDGSRSDEFSPIHTYPKNGQFTIELTAFNDCAGATTSQSIMISTTGVAELKQLERFEAYPNPFNFTTTIEYRLTDLQKTANLVVRDILGRNIANLPINQKEGFLAVGKEWQPGVYFIQLAIDDAISPPLKVFKNSQ